MLNETAKLAKFLLEINAIKLNPETPFVWTSGIKSPIYCDNRLVLSYPEVRSFVKTALAKLISEKFPDCEVVAGIATAGIAHGALVADEMNLPGCYVRPEPKKHGLKNQIEGHLAPGSKVVLVEDLISTGKSSLQAAEAVREAGSEVVGLVALFTYGFNSAVENFKNAGVEFYTLSNFDAMCDVAAENGYLSADKLSIVKEFAKNPADWGNQFS